MFRVYMDVGILVLIIAAAFAAGWFGRGLKR